MLLRLLTILMVLAQSAVICQGAAAQSANEINQGVVGVIAGSIDGTSMLAASDLATVLDKGNELRVLPIQGKGSVQAITDLLYLRGIDLAIVQRDALEYSRREGIHRNLENRVRYISKLFNEEMHVVAGRGVGSIGELAGRKVNIGPPGSGSDLTASLILDALGVEVEVTRDNHRLALQKLILGEISAMFYIGGKPTPLLQSISAQDDLHLLPIEYTPELLELYLPASFDDGDYAGLMTPGQKIDTLSVEAILAVYNWPEDNPRYGRVTHFVEEFFGHLDQLQQPPQHRKWQDVSLKADLPGWRRFAAAESLLAEGVAVASDDPFRSQFDRYLQERNLNNVPDALKQELFQDFQRWQGSQSWTFALVPKVVNNAFFTEGYNGCKQAEEELNDVECLYIGPGEHTEQEQAQILQELVESDIDGIAVSPTSSPLIAGVLRRAQEAGIPVITWDSDLEEKDKGLRLTYLGSDNYQIGVQLAEATQRLLPGGGKICLMTISAGSANTNLRMQAIRDTLGGKQNATAPGERLNGENGWFEVADCPVEHDNDVNLATKGLGQILDLNPDLNAVLSVAVTPQLADEDFRAVMESSRPRLKSGELILVMADTLPMQMDQLKDGLSNVQVGQRPYEMGYRAMFVLRDLVNGKSDIDDPIYTDLDICTAENADSCIFGKGGPLIQSKN